MTKEIKIGLMMIAAVSVAMLTGCSSNDFVEEIVPEEYPIEFSSNTQHSTRAVISSPEELATAGGFYVWGWKTPTTDPLDWTSGTYQVFSKQSVTSTTGTYIEGVKTNWTYSPIKYWDSKSTYCFYAAGPINSTGTISVSDEDDASKKVIRVNGAGVKCLPNTDAEYNDYVITRTPVKRDGANTTDNVDFTFHHIMSKVAVKLKSGIGDKGTITVTDLKMTGWDNALRDFVQELSYNPSTPSYSEWHYHTNTTYTTGTATLLSGASVTLPTTDTSTDVETYYIMVPQTISANTLKFVVSFTITYSDGVTDTFTDMEGYVTTVQNWYTDCFTTYTLTISPNPIKFNVSSVNWTGTENQTINISQ